jgi:hypothetical protein
MFVSLLLLSLLLSLLLLVVAPRVYRRVVGRSATVAM